MADPLAEGRYEIVVGANLHPDWSEWFGLEVTADGDTTCLIGRVPDQAALHGILAQLRDLGLPILALRQVPDE